MTSCPRPKICPDETDKTKIAERIFQLDQYIQSKIALCDAEISQLIPVIQKYRESIAITDDAVSKCGHVWVDRQISVDALDKCSAVLANWQELRDTFQSKLIELNSLKLELNSTNGGAI